MLISTILAKDQHSKNQNKFVFDVIQSTISNSSWPMVASHQFFILCIPSCSLWIFSEFQFFDEFANNFIIAIVLLIFCLHNL